MIFLKSANQDSTSNSTHCYSPVLLTANQCLHLSHKYLSVYLSSSTVKTKRAYNSMQSGRWWGRFNPGFAVGQQHEWFSDVSMSIQPRGDRLLCSSVNDCSWPISLTIEMWEKWMPFAFYTMKGVLHVGHLKTQRGLKGQEILLRDLAKRSAVSENSLWIYSQT